MQRTISILILLACLTLLPVTPAAAGFFGALFGDDTLVTIDETRYSEDDFKRWWKFWQEPGQPLPKTPDPYIDWLLLSQEAERMGLAEDPGFKRQTRVFLQSRALLMLKNDAVDSRIEVADAEVKARYEERFLPRWLVKRMEFKDEETALAAWKEMEEGALTIDSLLARNPEQGGPISTSESWARPGGVDAGWNAIFLKTAVGTVVKPDEHNRGPVLYFLKEQKGGDDKDLDQFREAIRKGLWKAKQNDLTRALLLQLRDKYQVEIDKERLAALDLNASDDTFTDAAVITTNRQNVSEKEFIDVIRRLTASRPGAAHALADAEKARQLKEETADNIIGQSVTDWEALDRHYEEKEPFKWEYEFNLNHRLGVALSRRIFMPKCVVTDDEIKQRFEQNIGNYTQPALVKFYIVDETQGPIDRIWASAAGGKTFLEVVKQHDLIVSPKEVPANHLEPDVKAVVDNLAVGETSRIFKAQGVRVMVHLVAKTPEAPLPLERVKKSIHDQIEEEKLMLVRDDFLNSLKSGIKIDVNKRQWKAIQKELGGA